MCVNCGEPSYTSVLNYFEDQLAEMRKTPEQMENEINALLDSIRDATVKSYPVTDNISLHLLSYIPQYDVTNVINWLRRLNEVAPTSGKVEVYAPYTRAEAVDASTYRLDSNGRMTYESVDSDTPHRLITLSPNNFFRPDIKTAADANRDDPNWSMPVGHHVSNPYYNVVHEWGHVVDTRIRDNVGTMEMAIKRKLTSSSPVALDQFASSLSTYGLSDEAESFAEAFTEWHISKGKTHNFAAKWYAREYNWHTYN